MYDELVKRMRKCATEAGACKTCELDSNPSCTDVLMEQAADAIEQLIEERDAYRKAMTHEHNRAAKLAWEKEHCWIPVTDRLPDEYVNVLCHLRSLDRQSEYYSIDHLMEDGQWWKASNSWKYAVTHWMPLPEPPKEET